VPIEAAKIIGTLSQQALEIHVRLRQIDRDLLVWQRGSDVARRLMTIPGIGPIGATALAASVTNLLIVGMTSLVRRAKYHPETVDPRLADLLARKPVRVATVAMANKTARVVWAVMARGNIYCTGHRPALAA
jgi:transposase